MGTYIEHEFKKYLEDHYTYGKGSSAKGIDLPEANIQTDIKLLLKNSLNLQALLKTQNKKYLD